MAVTGYTSSNNKFNHNIVCGNCIKRVFKIPVGNIPEEEIDDYIRKIAAKFKEIPADLDCEISLRNYFPISATTTTHFMHVEPNSHFWEDLNHLLNYLNHISVNDDIGSEIEYLIIGLENTIKNGYKIKAIDASKTNPIQMFYSVQDIIKYLSEIRLLPLELKWLKQLIQNTIDNGINLTNGLKMERKDVYKFIDGERDYQDKTWVARRTADGTPDEEKPVAEWINYIEYHISKAKERVYHLDTQAALAEVRKIAALAVRTMEIHGAPERINKNDRCGGKKTKIDGCCSDDNSCDCK
jgi:hypothetical protein